MADKMRQILVRMPDDLYEAVKAHAESEERPVAAEIRRALRSHLAASS